MTDWLHVATVPEGKSALIDGVDIWQHRWKKRPEVAAVVKDPLYGQTYRFPVYEIVAGRQTIVFAAGEFSNGVFGIYRPRSNEKL